MNQFPLPTRELFATGRLDLLARPLQVLLIDTSRYQFVPQHGALADIPKTAVIAVSPDLAKKSVSDGVLRSEPIIITRVPRVEIGALAVVSTTDPGIVVYWIDTIERDPQRGMPGLPFQHNGGTIVLFPERSGIFTVGL